MSHDMNVDALRHWRRRAEEAEEEVRQLRAPPDTAFALASRLGLTVQEARFTAALMAVSPNMSVEYGALADAISVEEGIPTAIAGVRVAKLKAGRKIARLGATIQCRWGVGYHLDRHSHDALHGAIADRQPSLGGDNPREASALRRGTHK